MKQRIMMLFLTVALLAALCGCGSGSMSAYEQLKAEGYTGTEEQLIASLVGEQADAEQRGQTAFAMAAELGYRGSFAGWSRILTGSEETDEEKTAYQIKREHGFTGSLAEYLTALARDPKSLGKSAESDPDTPYEQALANGYEGSYIDWLIFLIE